jgi:hypothetical protein
MTPREGESALMGAVRFASIYAAESFIDWKLKQGCTIRLWHGGDLDQKLIVEFEP